VFDISPTFPSPLFYNIENVTLADWLSHDDSNLDDWQEFVQQITDTYGIEHIGQHYFQKGANGLTPVWDFIAYGPNAIASAKVVGDLPSPEPGSVDWQHLTVTSGVLAHDILNIYTNGGEPPSQVRIPRSVMCSARLNVAFFSVRPDQETLRSNSPHCIVSARLLTPK
jgi:hypothetical protein